MVTVLFLVFFGLICKAIKMAVRSQPRRKAAAAAPAESKVSRSLAALEALQAQRDELEDQLDLINAALDAAPPEEKRMKWMKERSRVYGQLAACESKISRLCGA